MPKRAGKTLRGSEEFFRSIFENIHVGIGIYDIETREHFTNRATHEILGYSQEELSRTEQWDEIVLPEDRAAGARRFADLAQGKREKDEWEQRFVRRDGRIVITKETCKLIRDAGGKPQYIVTLNEDVTERKHAEAERIRITKQMQLLLDSTGEAVYGVDLEGKCTFINRATCELTGYQADEALGRNMHELVHHHKPDGSAYPIDECPVTRAVRDGKGCRIDEESLWRRDGTSIPVEYSCFPIVEEGRIKGAVVTVSDITERKRAKEALQSRERLFRSIFENAQIGIGIYDVKAGEHISNRALHEMLGYSQKELGHLEQWDEIVHPDESAACAKRYSELVHGRRESDEYTQRFIRRDDQIVTATGRFTLTRDSEGQPHYIIALHEDITDRKRAEEALQGSERLFRSIFENSQIGISFFDIDGRAVFTNRTFQDMLGCTEKELNQPDKWDEIIHPDERVSGAEQYAQLVQGNREKDEWEQRFVHRDGRIIIASARFTLIRDANGKPQYVASLTEDITQRRQADEKLRASEQMFRSVFEGAQIGIGVFKIDTQEHISNRALHEMLDYTEEELNRLEQWDEISPKEERGIYARRYEALVKGKSEKDEYEQHFIRRDGRQILTKSRFHLLRDLAGNPQCVVALTEDITERRHAEEERERATRLFRTVFENAQIGIGILDLKAGKQLLNRAVMKLLGYSQEELSRIEQWDEIVHPDDRVTGAKRYAEVVAGNREDDEFTQRYIRFDGKIVTAIGRFRLIRGSAGEPQYVIALMEDITERLKAEQALAASERLFRTIFENAQVGISFFNVPTGQYHTNPALHEMLGRTEEELSSVEKWDLIVHPDERESGAQRYAELLAGEKDHDEWEQRFIRPDGRVVIANGRFKVIRDDSGKLQYLLNLSEDITERKRAEAELVTAKETAVAATKAKSEFLANMSHEIRTPMNAVLGMTRLALKTGLTPKQRDYLTKSQAAAETLLGIINDTLDFSKIEAGKLRMERTEFRLDSVLDNLSTVVSHRAQEKNLEFLVAAGKDLPDVLIGDPLRLGQVLINLANNAVKFTERGEIVVSVDLEEIVSDRIKLKFAVRDSGIGLTPGQSARLFQAFSQADSSTTRKYGGTGLGLSISKRLVELMEGNIWVESEYGRGSTFCFTAWFGVGTAVRREKVLPPGLTGIRALVVDDNAAAREILSETLRQFGLSVECVSSGDEALRELARADSSNPYQIVLMDWQMPGMDGLETSRRIKRAGNLDNLPKILMVTAFDREDIRLQAKEVKLEGFLLKPLSPSVLFDTLIGIYGPAGEEKATVSAGKADRDSPLVSGIRILLVEDNEMNQQVATELLESEGAKVTIANHGVEAVRILTQNNQPPPFDLVLMDLQMPEMDGFATTRQLRTKPHLKKLPIIAMTAHVMTEEVQRCLEAGMNDHVGKPIDPPAFFATLARWTHRREPELPESGTVTTMKHEETVFPEIEGVDVGSGLQRTAGNKQLYRDLLSQFVGRQGSTGNTIKEALESGDHSQAERLAHSLKGVAGNLGIKQIFVLAGALERAIRESSAGTKGLIEELTSAMDRQIRTIRAALLAAAVDEGKRFDARSADRGEVLAAISRLRERLEASAADAPRVFAEVAEILRGPVAAGQLDSLGAAVKAFDFEAALSKLEEIVEQYHSGQG